MILFYHYIDTLRLILTKLEKIENVLSKTSEPLTNYPPSNQQSQQFQPQTSLQPCVVGVFSMEPKNKCCYTVQYSTYSILYIIIIVQCACTCTVHVQYIHTVHAHPKGYYVVLRSSCNYLYSPSELQVKCMTLL